MGDLLLVTGDSSSDRYAARLVEFLVENDFNGRIHAAAGPETEEAGAHLVENLVDRSVVGLTEVFGSLPYFFSLMGRLDSLLDEEPIDAVLLMDFPGFNMRFARRVRKRGIPLFYYITPQVWAWGSGRIQKLRDWFTKLFVIFPFEEELLREEGADAEFVGHPLYEELKEANSRDLHDYLDLSPDREIVSFFPGSRDHEIDRHLEPMAETALNLTRESDTIEPIVSAAPTVDQNQFRELLSEEMMEALSVWNGTAFELLESSTLSLLASGTVTMEAAFAKTPMIVGYRTSWVTYWIGRMLVDNEQFAMPNLILPELDVPELIQGNFNAKQLTVKAREYLTNRTLRQDQREGLEQIEDFFESRTPEEAVGRDLLANLK